MSRGYRVSRIESYTDCRDFLLWREGSGETIEIVDLAVGSERRRGIGRSLVNRLLARSEIQGRFVWAITRESNGIARDFYRALGFRPVAVLSRFYLEEDAMMFGINAGERTQ